MAKNQGIVRLRGSIDGVTYTEGVNGKLSRSRTSLNKAKMDANPKFHRLRLMQEELASYSRYGALMRSGVRGELARIKPFRGVQRLNKHLNALKNEDTVNRMGQRTVSEGLRSARGVNMLMDFDFYGKTKVSSLIEKKFSIDLATGEAQILGFNPFLDLIAPVTATHVSIKSLFMGLDFREGLVSTTRSPEVYLPIADVRADLILQPDGLPATTAAIYYLVQIIFITEMNGFREIDSMDSAALTIIEIQV